MGGRIEKGLRGFSLAEVVVALVVFSVLFSLSLTLPFLVIEARDRVEKQDPAPVIRLYQDLKMNYFLSKDYVADDVNEEVVLSRIDGCVVRYYRTGDRVEKDVECTDQPALQDRAVVVGNVVLFDVLPPEENRFCFKIRRAFDSRPFEFCVGG